MALRPVERTYREPEKHKGPKDVDAAGRARSIQALGWGLYAGIPMGAATGFGAGKVFELSGAWEAVAIVLGVVLGPTVIYTVALSVTAAAGKGAGTLYNPSGKSTPHKKEYSRAQALVVRGEYEEAIIAFEAEIMDLPSDPEPYFRIARIYRDQLKDHDQALAWFKRATREAELSGGQEIRTRREMAEIFLHHRREPRKAAPELARLIEAYPNTPDGDWAAKQLAMIKEEIAKELGPG